MTRALTALLVAIALLAPLTATAQDGTATPTAGAALVDPSAIVTAIEEAEPPATLPGNEDANIELHTWEEHYGQALPNTEGAWVLTGSTQFPIASVIVFQSPENAQAGLGDFAVDTAAVDVAGLEAYRIADRGKWVCIATHGPVLLIGQAEPTSTEEDENVVRDRSCAAMAETHAWLVGLVSPDGTATPAS
jgi:hypothetical protein